MNEKIRFQDYAHYPPEFRKAWEFRDDHEFENTVEGDQRYFELALDEGLWNLLTELAQWEMTYTDIGERHGLDFLIRH